MNNRHNDWLRALDFYKQELDILRARLTEIAGKNTGKDVLQRVEHFENQFKIQTDNIERLLHNIKVNITAAGVQAKASGAGYIDSALLATHDDLERAFTAEESTVQELRYDFQQFSAGWM